MLPFQTLITRLELIRQYRFPVIEDDYDYDFHYSSSPILPLASSYYGSTSYNALRIGFASMNEKEMRETIGVLKKAI